MHHPCQGGVSQPWWEQQGQSGARHGPRGRGLRAASAWWRPGRGDGRQHWGEPRLGCPRVRLPLPARRRGRHESRKATTDPGARRLTRGCEARLDCQSRSCGERGAPPGIGVWGRLRLLRSVQQPREHARARARDGARDLGADSWGSRCLRHGRRYRRHHRWRLGVPQGAQANGEDPPNVLTPIAPPASPPPGGTRRARHHAIDDGCTGTRVPRRPSRLGPLPPRRERRAVHQRDAGALGAPPQVRCMRAVHACDACVRCMRAMHACDACMRCMHEVQRCVYAVHACGARARCLCAAAGTTRSWRGSGATA